MLSVVIGTLDDERALVPTLSALVSGAASGVIRNVIVADGGSADATAEVADIAGCEFFVEKAPLAERLRAGAVRARTPWLMFLRPGVVLDPSWTDECARFQQRSELQAAEDRRAAVFRPSSDAGAGRTAFGEALALLCMALSGHRTAYGLVIHRQFYDRLGGHHDKADPDRDLLTRIGRRQITMLRCEAFMTARR